MLDKGKYASFIERFYCLLPIAYCLSTIGRPGPWFLVPGHLPYDIRRGECDSCYLFYEFRRDFGRIRRDSVVWTGNIIVICFTIPT